MKSRMRLMVAAMGLALVAGCGGTPAKEAAKAPAAGAQPAAPAAAAPAPASSAPADGKLTPFRLGIMNVADCMQAFVADSKGFFKEQGLDVKMQVMKGGAEIAPAVAGGSLEAGWSNMVSIALAHEQGLGFAFFAPGMLEKAGAHPHRIVVSSASKFQNLKELAGQTVAVNTLDNIPYTAFVMALKKAGVDPKTVKFVEIPFPNMLAALKEEKVKAAIMLEPFVTTGLTDASIRVLDEKPFEAFGQRAFVGGWFASEKWLSANADVAGKFTAAIRKANEYMAKNPEDARKIMLNAIKLDQKIADKIVLGAFEDKVEPADLQPVIEITTELGLLKKSFPAAEILKIK